MGSLNVKPEEARKALRKGIDGSSGRFLTIERATLEAGLGSEAGAVLAEAKGRGEWVKVRRDTLREALDKLPAPAAPVVEE